ncbi:MAG: ribonuclease P protein component 1 [Candidatus Jordarchaeales archaeon]
MSRRKVSRKKSSVTAANLIRHELIGLKVKVAESLNNNLVGLTGTIVDETRNTIKLRCESGEKIIPKEVCIFMFELPNGNKIEVDGRLLNGRPEERIKMKKRKIVWPLTVERQLKKVRFNPAMFEVLPLDA